MPNWTGSCAGCRTYQTKDDRTVWVIRKMVKGLRYQIVLDVETERQALAQLALFDQDPASLQDRRAPRETRRGGRSRQEAEARRLQEKADAVYLYRAPEDQGSGDVLLLHATLGLHESEVQQTRSATGSA